MWFNMTAYVFGENPKELHLYYMNVQILCYNVYVCVCVYIYVCIIG